MEWIWIIGLQILLGMFIWWMVSTRFRKKGIIKKKYTQKDDSKELDELKEMRARSLNVPLSELARPAVMSDVVGQTEGIKALRAALCGPNPQHVLIYGPPGIGKTCAARLVLEEAKKSSESPFNEQSKFVEVDATCVRFDERAIADPLLGSVHDPIYQGAGSLGTQGVPQPKPGAVSKAHCGVLFLDEIGELHPMQMNKLLKVLEDRKVFFESAYYSEMNTTIPPHIHDIFKNGLPADFRLIGATTRSPDDIPPALRSRCVELYFKPLSQLDLMRIAEGALKRISAEISPDALMRCVSYAQSGRDIVNIVQLASGAAYNENRSEVTIEDVEWVARTCNYSKRFSYSMSSVAEPGIVHGMGVSGSGQGIIMPIECSAVSCDGGKGTLLVQGVIEEEEIEMRSRRLRRKSTAKSSVQNVMGVFKKYFKIDCSCYDIEYNIPGGMPMDGPSAGIALAVALMSALRGRATIPYLALTGEISIHGNVHPVGGVREKIGAAILSGAKTIIIPRANFEGDFDRMDATVIGVTHISEVMEIAFNGSLDAQNTEKEITHSA